MPVLDPQMACVLWVLRHPGYTIPRVLWVFRHPSYTIRTYRWDAKSIVNYVGSYRWDAKSIVNYVGSYRWDAQSIVNYVDFYRWDAESIVNTFKPSRPPKPGNLSPSKTSVETVPKRATFGHFGLFRGKCPFWTPKWRVFCGC